MKWWEWIRGKKGKKLKKDQWLIVLLAGILLLVIAVPGSCGNTSEKEESGERAKEEQDLQPTETYGEQLEKHLEQILARMEGVGRVRVMITLKDAGSAVVEKDITTSGQPSGTQDGETKGTGTAGEWSEKTVYTQESGGEPFVNRQIAPGIAGVLVVAEGGDDTAVAKNISEAVEALFSVDAHKIKVVKMNSQEGSN